MPIWRLRQTFDSTARVAVLAALLGSRTATAAEPIVPVVWPFSGKDQTRAAAAPMPDPSRGYDSYHQQYVERPLVAPAQGLTAPSEPGWLKRMGTSISDSSFGRGVKSLFSGSRSGTTGATTASKPKPRDPVAEANLNIQLAGIQEQAGNLQLTEQLLRRAVTSDPKNPQTHAALARFLDRQERHDEAAEVYLKVIRLDPDDPTAYNDLGLCYAKQRRFDEAMVQLNRAIERAPQRKLYRNNAATVLVEMGQIDLALRHLKAAHGEAVGHYNLGYLLSQKGDLARARREFYAAASKDPGLHEAQVWLAALADPQRSRQLVEPDEMPDVVAEDTPTMMASEPAANEAARVARRSGKTRPAGRQSAEQPLEAAPLLPDASSGDAPEAPLPPLLPEYLDGHPERPTQTADRPEPEPRGNSQPAQSEVEPLDPPLPEGL